LQRQRAAILLIEQQLSIALRISRRVYIMGHGRIAFEGTPAELKINEVVRKSGWKCKGQLSNPVRSKQASRAF